MFRKIEKICMIFISKKNQQFIAKFELEISIQQQ